MTKRKNPRLAYCEYVAPDSSSITIEQARWGLMRCVRRVFREMLEQLAVDVLPAYKELAKSDFDIDAILWNSRLSPFKKLPQNSSLRTELSKWASTFHAEQDWFLDEMLRTLRGWHVAPDWRSDLKCNPIGRVISTVAMGDPFKFDCEGWEMQLLTWAAYSRSVRERFEKHLAEYEKASRTLAESRGLVRSPHKYSSVNLDYFVLYQFAGLSSTKIADRSDASAKGESESTILKGVKTAARLIGWDSLRTTPGRPNRKIRK
jgi:hypothetical protein